MRYAWVVMAMVLSACVASVEGGPSEPSESVGVVTTAVLTGSTTVGEDCEGEERGYQCPPDLFFIEERRQDPAVHSSGTYSTRIFQPRLQFTRLDVFTGFEAELEVRLDEQGCTTPVSPCWQTILVADGPASAIDLEDIAAQECATDVELTEGKLLGIAAQVLDFGVQVDCNVNVHELTGIYYDRNRLRFYKLGLDDETELLVIVRAPVEAFDTYFTEVAQPVIDSIRFLDQ